MYHFVWSLVKHQITQTPDSAHTVLLAAQDLNPVWQKFCQTLACRDDIIDPVLAGELVTLLDHCPPHSQEWTATVLQSLDIVFDSPLTETNLIGSGTIAQVYRGFSVTHQREVAVKIKHPHMRAAIDEAVQQYNALSNSFWFPRNLKSCGDEFFTALYRQEDFTAEFVAGNTMRHMLEEATLLVVPRMLMVSEHALIMDYEAGTYHLRDIPDVETRDQVCLGLIYFHIVSVFQGFLHADLHWGNFSIRTEPLQIVLYDFGLTLDLKEVDQTVRQQWAQAFFDANALRLFQFITPDATHLKAVTEMLHALKDASFSAQVKRVLLYCQMHSLVYDVTMMSVLYACIHCDQLEKTLSTMPTQTEAIARLPYPEFACLQTLAGK